MRCPKCGEEFRHGPNKRVEKLVSQYRRAGMTLREISQTLLENDGLAVSFSAIARMHLPAKKNRKRANAARRKP